MWLENEIYICKYTTYDNDTHVKCIAKFFKITTFTWLNEYLHSFWICFDILDVYNKFLLINEKLRYETKHHVIYHLFETNKLINGANHELGTQKSS